MSLNARAPPCVPRTMNAAFFRILMAGLVGCSGVSCMTAYDAYGYPQQVVDPGVAIAGAAAAGLLAYGLANNNNHHHSHYRHYNRHGGHRGGYFRPSYHRGHGGFYHRGHGRGFYH
jgi:hypothetical protein